MEVRESTPNIRTFEVTLTEQDRKDLRDEFMALSRKFDGNAVHHVHMVWRLLSDLTALTRGNK